MKITDNGTGHTVQKWFAKEKGELSRPPPINGSMQEHK